MSYLLYISVLLLYKVLHFHIQNLFLCFIFEGPGYVETFDGEWVHQCIMENKTDNVLSCPIYLKKKKKKAIFSYSKKRLLEFIFYVSTVQILVGLEK